MTDHDPNNLHGGRPPFTLMHLAPPSPSCNESEFRRLAMGEHYLDHRDWLQNAPDEEVRREVLALLQVMRSLASSLYLSQHGKTWLDVTDELWRCTHQLDRACNAAGRPLPWPNGPCPPPGREPAQQPTPPTD
jgi:hypothetical protein